MTRTRDRKRYEMSLPKLSRKEAGNRLGVCERQIQRYLKIAVSYLSSFSAFLDPATKQLNGTPITEKELGDLERVRDVLRKYKNSKNREQQIASELSDGKH